MDFDFENFDKYLQPEISADSQAKIDLLNSHIRVDRISARECKFIGDVERRIRAGKTITDLQKQWLARIIRKCRQ